MKTVLFSIALFQFTLLGSSQLVGDTLMRIITPADHEMLDIDNDGDFDLVVVGHDDIVWYENEGGEEFGALNYILEDITGHFGMYVADLNGDGFMDFTAYYDDGGDKISWFENMGDNTFTENEIVTVTTNTYELIDDDADGDFDLFYTVDFDGVFRIPGGLGGTFGTVETIHDATYNYFCVYHTDFNNDGDEDVIFGTQDPFYTLHYSENLGGGLYAASSIALADILQRPNVVEFADMDNDGDQDWILGLGYENYGLHYYENTGAELGEDYSFMESSGGGIAMGDLDLDGYKDIVGLFTKSQHKWIRNNGDGTFSDGEELPVDIWEETGWLTALSSVHLYDFDADGDLEIYGETVQDHFYFMEYRNLVISDYNATGSFFADLNENGIWDAEEVGVDFPGLESDPVADAFYVAPSGEYFIGFPYEDDISYTITPSLPEHWEISTLDEDYTVLIDGVTPWENLDFGIFPTEDIDSIRTELVGGYPRCNDTINYWISIDNFGTTRPEGIISLVLDDSIGYVSSAIMPDSVVEQSVYWSYDDLPWYDDLVFTVQVRMPDYLSEDDTIISYLSTSIIDDGGEEIFLAEDELSQRIICAYDPNDKIGFPFGVDDPGYISIDETSMEYTIRFQNTGSDTAFTVRIEDQLDDNFDWDSFQVLAKSHNMEWSVDGDGRIEFLFENIALPDSNVNKLGSQGFVRYRISIEEGLLSGTELKNAAEIYFDLNPAVLTDTTLHTMYNCETILANVNLPTHTCFGDSIFGTTDGIEIPSTTVFTWDLGDETVEGDDFAYLETDIGEHEILVTATTNFCEASASYFVTVLSEIGTTELSPISVCFSDSVEVFGEYRTEAGIYSETRSSEVYGCDSTITQEVMFLVEIEPTDLAAVSICFADSVEIFGEYRTEAGVYSETLSSEVYGCDSIITQEVMFLAEIEPTDLAIISICLTDSVEVFGEYRTEAGVYSETLLTEIYGCDSIVNQEIVLFEVTETFINELADDVLCLDEASFLLTAVPPGGIFDGVGVDGDNFNPALSGAGNHTIYYAYEDFNECRTEDSLSLSVVDCLGNEFWNKNELSVYPNPFSEATLIQFSRNFELGESIVIIDMQGREIRRYANLSGQQITIERGEMVNGLYLLEVLNAKGKQEALIRLIVE